MTLVSSNPHQQHQQLIMQAHFIVVLCLAVLASAKPAYLEDTPEVAAAKAAHFAEVARAAVAAYYPYLGYSSYAGPAITPEGFVADTPEVAAAKSAHFAEKAKAAAASANIIAAPVVAASAYPYYAYPYAAYPAYPSVYSGPLAIPTVLPSGHLADTPEVQAAKAAHFAEVAKASAQA